MKKNWKSALSLLFVLVFMLQIAGVTASAQTDPSVTGNEPLSIAVYIPTVNADGYEVSARMDGESVNLPEGKTLSMNLGGSELGYWSTISLSDLMNSDLTITPPEGYYVAEAYIYAGELAPGQSPASLEGTADYPSTTGTRVTLKSANFADEYDPWSFDSARLSSIGGSYTLLIRLELLEKISYVTVSYSSGEAYANVPPAEGGSFGTSFTVQPMFESVPGKRFTGWQLTYGSGSVVDVSTGSQIQPYADCTLVAQWEDEEAPVDPGPVDPFVPVEPVPEDPFLPVEPSVHEHSWYETGVTPATCESDGVRYLTCSECNETMSEVIPATGHSYYDTVVPPTYEAEGYTEHTCVNCGASYRDTYVPKLEHVHSYVEQITQNATCTAPGLKTFTCDCGDSYTEEIPATGHSYTETVVAPTYEAEGYTEHICSVCGDSYRDNYVPKLEHVHSYTEQITKEPTCTEAGVKTFTCECGDSYTEEIPATGHSYTENVVAPTYEAEGYTEHTCSVCGDSYRDNFVPKLEHTHSYTEQITKEPSCTEAGVKTFTCECGDSYTEEIPATGHSYTEQVTQEPTCTVPGVKTFTCANCGDTYTQEIPMADHDYEVTVIDATVNAEGYTLHKCKVCGYEFRDSYTPKKEMQILPAPVFSAPSWTRGGNGSITATVNYDFAKFDSLLVDGVKMTRDADYSVRQGSTIIDIPAGTLEKFAAGEREIKVVFTDAESTGKLTIAEPAAPEKVSLTVKAKDRTAEYTGELITANEYEIVSGKLNSGDTIKAEYSGGSVNVTNGATSTISKIVITDASGKDVTASAYNVAVQNGTVVVTARRLSIMGQNVTKTYDGSTFSLQNEYASKISSDKISGHALSINLDIYQNGARVSGARDAGSYDIMLSAYTVKDASGNDVSGNYSFFGTLPYKLGTLTIQGSPASMTPVTVTAKSQTWAYDGQPHDCKEYTLSSNLLDGDTITVNFDPSSVITDAGSVANRISSVVIKDRNGNGVPFALNGQGSGKYNVTLAEGTLKIEPFKVTLTAVSAEKYYDGSALKNDNVKATALVSGHKFSVVKFAVTDSQGNLIKNGPVSVGTYTKKVTDVTIVDSRGSDVTRNYDISKVDGTLKVLQGNGSNNSKSPRTGDENNVILWIGLLAASALVVLGIVAYFYFRNRKGGARPAAKRNQTSGKH